MLLRHKPQCPLKHSRYSINTNDHCHYVLGYLLILSITSVNFSLRVPPAQICSSLFIMSMRLTCSFSISVSQDPYIKKKIILIIALQSRHPGGLVSLFRR